MIESIVASNLSRFIMTVRWGFLTRHTLERGLGFPQWNPMVVCVSVIILQLGQSYMPCIPHWIRVRLSAPSFCSLPVNKKNTVHVLWSRSHVFALLIELKYPVWKIWRWIPALKKVYVSFSCEIRFINSQQKPAYNCKVFDCTKQNALVESDFQRKLQHKSVGSAFVLPLLIIV